MPMPSAARPVFLDRQPSKLLMQLRLNSDVQSCVALEFRAAHISTQRAIAQRTHGRPRQEGPAIRGLTITENELDDG